MRVFCISALILATVALPFGCQSTGGDDPANTLEAIAVPPSPDVGRVTMNQGETTIGYAVRAINEQIGAGLVLVNGVEDRLVGPFMFEETPLDEAASRLAVEAGCAVEFGPYYHFIYPSGYESLINISLQGRIHPKLNQPTEGIAFGTGLPLHMLFVWIGYAREITIVADHLIADTRCGELAVGNAPLDASLEAVFKSARLASFEVESTDEYIFVRAAVNRTSGPQLLNPEALDERRRGFLERSVTVTLPHKETNTIEMAKGAVRLSSVLASLTNQLGVRVEAEKALHDLPVVPAYYHDLKVETILDLLIRQWPVPAFGYYVLADRIVIATRRDFARPMDDASWKNRPILE